MNCEDVVVKKMLDQLKDNMSHYSLNCIYEQYLNTTVNDKLA